MLGLLYLLCYIIRLTQFAIIYLNSNKTFTINLLKVVAQKLNEKKTCLGTVLYLFLKL